MPLIDLSPPVTANSPHWPGDHGFTSTSRWSTAEGDSVSVATVTTTGHVGAHVDAPSHVRRGAPNVEHLPLDAGIGPCLVLDVSALVDRGRTPNGYARLGQVLDRLRELAVASPVERLLLRHRTSPGNAWLPDSPGLDPELVTWFGAQGGRLLGIDLDSFDPLESSELPAHRAAVDAGVVIAEGLDLRHAPEGHAELYALPAPWSGVDSAPLRAVLRV